MNWIGMSPLFFLSMIKFMFAPFGGKFAELSFFETYISCCSGAIVSAAIFYFSAGYFMKKTAERNKRRMNDLLHKGLPIPVKKRFTRTNKLVVKMKRAIGIIGVSFWVPFLFSIPLGSIITAKFYGDNRKTFSLIVIGILLNGLITTGITYLFNF